MRIFVLFILLVIIVSGGCNRKAKSILPENKGLQVIDDFGFVRANSLGEVVEFAKIQNKLVFLDMYTDWCLPCKMMDEDVFSDRSLGRFFSDHFVSYKVNAESEGGSELAELFEVQGFPTLLFLDQRGRVLEKKMGLAYQDEMYELADAAIANAIDNPSPE